ncbi:metabotropic glutamate receptor 5-like [Agrilus planipennis]|uniref:Metabotropic glutamate receptor 5-like n=1 Tax=Agrilus planipennis TaxID=224129 RepID=A0A1W4XGD8_AGRPL|nr:metabotropic glutamate receptor 5-like [Agrilus planipennis]
MTIALITLVGLSWATCIQVCDSLLHTNSSDHRTAAFINGDFIVGALFPIHHQPPSEMKRLTSSIRCGTVREQYGIQRVEATFHTIDEINKNSILLPNMTLGVEIRDECWYAPVALQESIELIKDALNPSVYNLVSCGSKTESAVSSERRGTLIGVIGPGASSVTLQVQNLLQLFQIPQVGYSSTSSDLSDKSRFSFFMRVVPSDYHQAQLMLDIVKYYNWSYVSIVNTNENYGQSGIQAFREVAELADVCIAQENSILSGATHDAFDKVILNLKRDDKARVVVCFCEGLTIRGLLMATRRLNLTNHFLFIGSDGWADRNDVTEGYEAEAWGSISIRIYSPYVKEFDDYYLSLRPNTNTRNPWFKELWETHFGCRVDDDAEPNKRLAHYKSSITDPNNKINKTLPRCTGNETLEKEYRQDPKLSFVIKAIYTFANALHNMYMNVCGPSPTLECGKSLTINGSEFKNYLTNVSFTYKDTHVEFDENGDPPAKYDILNFQKTKDGKYDYVPVGEWYNGTLTWIGEFQFGPYNQTVKSVCSDPCPLGHAKRAQQSGKDKKCCWVCQECSPNEIVTEKETCELCPQGSKADPLQKRCIELLETFVTWYDMEGIVSLFMASWGLILTTATLSIFIKYRDTPVVKSSTKELSYIILVGMIISYLAILPILAKPSQVTCSLGIFVPGVSFGMIYSALLTKTNRISRILAGSKKKIPTRKPLFMSATAQVIITVILIMIEAMVCGAILLYESPTTTYRYKPDQKILECSAGRLGVLGPLIFDFFLIFMCTCYAVKTRNVPENFNEAKFIGFAMYTTCVIWLSFIALYFGSQAKVITHCLSIVLSSIVAWTFLFAPKLYIIIFRPEKNNRAFFTTSKNIRCHIGCRVSSAISEKSSLKSWRESCFSCKEARNVPEKRTLSCQTGSELLEILLNPLFLEERNSLIVNSTGPRITERDCCDCEHDGCQIKKITIKLPNNSEYKM